MATPLKASATGESACVAWIAVPASPHATTLGSNGTRPRKLTPVAAAVESGIEVENRAMSTLLDYGEMVEFESLL